MHRYWLLLIKVTHHQQVLAIKSANRCWTRELQAIGLSLGSCSLVVVIKATSGVENSCYHKTKHCKKTKLLFNSELSTNLSQKKSIYCSTVKSITSFYCQVYCVFLLSSLLCCSILKSIVLFYCQVYYVGLLSSLLCCFIVQSIVLFYCLVYCVVLLFSL